MLDNSVRVLLIFKAVLGDILGPVMKLLVFVAALKNIDKLSYIFTSLKMSPGTVAHLKLGNKIV